MLENQDPFPQTKTEEVAKKEPKPKELTTEFLQEKLSALEEAFEPFYNECGFYAVEINLQGNFNSKITKALKLMRYETRLHPEGYIENKSKKITVTLT